MSRPTDYPEWASGGGASVAEPEEGKKDLGWVDEEIPPETWFNWLFLTIYQWIVYLDEEHDKYAYLQEAIAGLSTGDSAVVNQYNPAQAMFYPYAEISESSDGTAMAGDGEYFYVGCVSGKIQAFKVTSGGYSVIWTSTDITDQIEDLYADGTALYAVAGTKCYRLNRATGALVWGTAYNHGTGYELYGVCTNGYSYVYVTGEFNGTSNVVQLNASDGTSFDSYALGAVGNEVTGKGIFCDGRWVAVAHTCNSDGDNEILSLMDIGIDTVLAIYDDYPSNGYDCCIADGQIFLAGTNAVYCLQHTDLSVGALALVWKCDLTVIANRVCCDHRRVLVGTNDSTNGGPGDAEYNVVVLDRRTGHVLGTVLEDGANADVKGVYSDGFAVGVAISNGTAYDVAALQLLQKPVRVVKMDGNDIYRNPQHQLAMVCDE